MVCTINNKRFATYENKIMCIEFIRLCGIIMTIMILTHTISFRGLLQNSSSGRSGRSREKARQSTVTFLLYLLHHISFGDLGHNEIALLFLWLAIVGLCVCMCLFFSSLVDALVFCFDSIVCCWARAVLNATTTTTSITITAPELSSLLLSIRRLLLAA